MIKNSSLFLFDCNIFCCIYFLNNFIVVDVPSHILLKFFPYMILIS